jgi:hypothetical protein
VTRQRIRDSVVSARIEHVEYDLMRVTICCGQCGHQQEVSAGNHTSHCRRCNRVMNIDKAIRPGGNVIPIRKTRTG